MKISPFSSAWLPQLTSLVNQHIAQIPPGWSLSERQIASLLPNPLAPWNDHYPEIANTRTETYCAILPGKLLAAVGRTIGEPPDPNQKSVGTIAWIVSDPEHPAALQILFEHILEKCRSQGVDELVTGRYAFGIGWLGIPETWPHLKASFQEIGFSCKETWRLMTRSTPTCGEGSEDLGRSMKQRWLTNEAAQEWILQLWYGEVLVGECEAWGIPRHFADCQDYAQWVTIEWLGVEAAHQRQGYGRWLLSQQLARQVALGRSKAILWAEGDHPAMIALGKSLGFQVGPLCLDFAISTDQN